MRLKLNMLVMAGLFLTVGFTNALGQTMNEDPSQLGTRQLEVRVLDVPYEVAYQAATQAMFTIGYTISHSDKVSGLLTGSRVIGVTEMKKETKQAQADMSKYQDVVREERATKQVLSMVPYVGILAPFMAETKPPEIHIEQPNSYQVTMLLKAMGDKQTQIRFKLQKDGEPVWDQTTIDKLWVTTQREAMIESGPPPSPAAVSTPAAKPDAPTTPPAPSASATPPSAPVTPPAPSEAVAPPSAPSEAVVAPTAPSAPAKASKTPKTPKTPSAKQAPANP
jgi:hypothetical protein